ncbi:translation initiation factor IF-1 [Candidatus Liberibacter africanus]|uniref:translation initiation factor IF-1 n=1 Tax=Liberibacter africanus TaxID=34020 RepID=UPI003857D525
MIVNDGEYSADNKSSSQVGSELSKSDSELIADSISCLENSAVIAYTAGRMRKHRIRISIGDRVKLEMNPYDMTRARITYRFKD